MTELRTRPATDTDYPTFARLFPELAVPDPLPSEDAFIARMMDDVVIVEDAGSPVGYGFSQVYGKSTHVVHVVAAKEARGRGVGAAIMSALRARAIADGCTRWFLNVKQENVPAIRVYERAGMSREAEGWTLRMPWSALTKLPDVDPALHVTTVTPDAAEDAALAARFGLDAARLGSLRNRRGVVLLVTKGEGRHGAFAAFDPVFPGIYPIRVEHPMLAKPLMQAFVPHAKHDYTNVWVEENHALRDVLVGAGAEQQFSIYRMSSALP